MNHKSIGSFFDWIPALLFAIIVLIYILAVVLSNRHHKKWPLYRTVFWVFGVFCIACAATGPLARHAHSHFTTHMLGHLFLGMLAPLLMALAAPLTLILRTLHVNAARRLSRLLKSWPVGTLSDPMAASLLNIGGLWVLYTTGLYKEMQQNLLLQMFIHIHIFLAGYFFTISIIYIDPTPHRTSFVYRAIILVLTSAGHGILAKYIYSHPPSYVSVEQAELGGIIMYYGGDAITLVLIVIFFWQWYRANRLRAMEQDFINF